MKQGRRAGKGGRKSKGLIVIGTSAGGVETLPQLLERLPADLPAPVFIVLHCSTQSGACLPQVLCRYCRLPAKHPADKERFRAGHIYVARPDYHMLIEDGRIRLDHGPKENRHRPAIDPLFRTAAAGHGKGVIGVVLTGTLDDGAMGLKEIRNKGGRTIVQ